MDSNHRRYKPADLQSAPFGHSGILPFFSFLSGGSFVGLLILAPHNLQVAALLAACPSWTHPEINFKNFVLFCGLLRRTSHPRSAIYVSKLLSSSFVRLESLPKFNFKKLSRWRESNPRPRDYKSRALAN